MASLAPKAVLCVGHAVQDFVFGVEQLPLAAEKVRARSFAAVGGGPAANAAVAIARLGGRAALAARVGDDVVGDLILADLAREGVACALVERLSGCGSSVSAVMVDASGARAIVNSLDPAWSQEPRRLAETGLSDATAVLCDSRWPEGAAVALDLARAAGIPGVLDADATEVDLGPLVGAASHVAFSEQGLREFTGVADVEAGLSRARSQTAAWMCVTLGEAGALVAPPAGPMVRVPAFTVRAVDTLGAGDVWHGAFALALGEGAGESGAVRFAAAAAAIKVTRPGGRQGAPTRAEVEKFLQTTEQAA